jgi:hypothetical protein
VIVLGSVKGTVTGTAMRVFSRAFVLTVLLASLAFASSASASSAWWQLNSLSYPTNLAPGGSGTLVLMATNLGDADVSGSVSPVRLVGKLPAGVTATAVSGSVGGIGGFFGMRGSLECSLASSSVVECSYSGTLPAYELLEASVSVNVEAGAKSGEQVEISTVGGETYACNETPQSTTGKYASSVCDVEGAGHFEKELSGKPLPAVTARTPLKIGNESTEFGVETYEMNATEENGLTDTQAGSHPFNLTTTLELNRTDLAPYQPAPPKDLHFSLPPGLVGNPTPFPQCSDTEFAHIINDIANSCPSNTALGVAVVTIVEPHYFGTAPFTLPVPVFNLKPTTGEPARFGFMIVGVLVVLDTSVRTGDDYGVTVSVNNITQVGVLLGSIVTFWGVPGDRRHDGQRGWECLSDSLIPLIEPNVPSCSVVGQTTTTPPPFLSLPTSCTGELQTSVEADSWLRKGNFVGPVSPLLEPSLDGCNRLPFDPSLSVAPDSQQSSTPTGLTVGIHVPQDLLLNPTGLAESNVKDTTVSLPAGVALNPAAADGLEACSEAQIGLSEDAVPSCPEASKVATVEIHSPLLPNPLVGEAYLAAQNANPFGSLVALYLVAQDPVSGTLVKLAGEVKPDPVTGQLVSTFKNTPQLPFEDLKLHFFGGDRAPLSTPASCGSYTTVASIAPWSGNDSAEPSSTFEVVSGPDHSACASPLPFAPELTAGATNIQAGAFSPFTMTMSRQDGQQNLNAVQLRMPPGLLGTLSGVKLCDEAAANAGTCGSESLIGHTIVSVGLGGDPYSVTGGQVFITGPYEDAPYGLSIVNPAKAGPFDLGKVIVRAKVEVDPTTAALTITTDSTGPYAIPQIIDGIPLQIKHVNVVVDRQGFTFNPTNCAPMAITGSLTSSQGATSALSVPFQVTNCATLGFKPRFSVATNGKTSRVKGAGLDVKLAYPKAAWGSLANIRTVKVSLPRQLPSRMTTLQKACPAGIFNANPASCPSGSRVGTATATTPIIPVALKGPAYFVSYGGAKFPELVIVLSGYGTTVQLHGETFISKAGITSSTFRQIPDVPIGSFELKLPQGSNSALAANGNLCTSTLRMPTSFVAQNGMVIHQSTPVTATGCAKHKAKKHKTKKGKK